MIAGAVACSAEPPPVTTLPTPTPLAIDAGPPPAAQRFKTLEAAASAVGCTDLQDLGTGGNAGLRAFGVCHLGHRNIDIYLTSQRRLWEHISQQFPSVFGPGWIIVTPTGEDAARYVRAQVGGRVVLPAP